MASQPPRYRGYRVPSDIISPAVWLHQCFGLSFCKVEGRLAEIGSSVTDQGIRQWCLTFGLDDGRRLRRRRGDTWALGEEFVKIQGRQQYLWRAVDEESGAIDNPMQSKGNRRAAIRVSSTGQSLCGMPANLDSGGSL